MNPYDVFPPLDLPYEAVPWGRSVQDRIIELENSALSADMSSAGENRTSAASLGQLARQLDKLNTTVVQVQGLYDALPIAFQRTRRGDGFSLPDGEWTTVASATLYAPRAGTAVISATSTGSQRATSTSGATINSRVSARLVLNGDASPSIPGTPDIATLDSGLRSNYNLSYGWTLAVSEGESLNVSLQLRPSDNAGRWGAHSDTYAVMSLFGTVSSS